MSGNATPLGVLLVNLGTPDEPTPRAIRRYLAEFLADPRVVDLPRLLWLPILYGFILPLRPRRLVEKYEYIWTEDGGPIRTLTASLASAVESSLAREATAREIRVLPAMTYGNPSIASAIEAFRESGIQDLMVVPLFPQYSAATTAAVFDKLAATLARSSAFGDIRFIDEYFASTAYVHALTKSLEGYANQLDDGARLLFSFHGIPVSQEQAGDPYPSRCRATAEILAHNLGLSSDQWMITFQSRFGPAPWVQPYTDETLKALAQSGTSRVVVVCPGFATDCLETVHEIDVEGRETFMAAGGTEFTYVPALNASEDHVKVLSHLILARLYPAEAVPPG
ncbi:MAG TPA: ferrochelatase [Pseudomonadales bacterium]|nr:ferrochelatase [Pseudomonadales bacterium]